jgi:hypothetical protein
MTHFAALQKSICALPPRFKLTLFAVKTEGSEDQLLPRSTKRSQTQQRLEVACLQPLCSRLRDAAEISLQSGAFVWSEAV